MAHPGLGYVIDNVDITDHNLYSEVMKPFGKATKLPALAYQSKTFSDLEDENIWSRSWVAIGSTHEIPQVGDLLPYTVGHHGIHVQRIKSDTIIGRFNKAQHGGCRAVPAQCQTGNKTKCSFTSCGYSLDSKPINNIEIEESNAISHQYLGVVPERLISARTFELGSYIFANINPDTKNNADPEILISEETLDQIEKHNMLNFSDWFECSANWKLLSNAILSTFEPDTENKYASSCNDNENNLFQLQFVTNNIFYESNSEYIQVLWISPNLIIISFEEYTISLIIQPTGLRKSLLRVLICSSSSNPDNFNTLISRFNKISEQILSRANSTQEAFSSLANDIHTNKKSLDKESFLEESNFGDYFNKVIAQQICKKNDYFWNVPLFKNVL